MLLQTNIKIILNPPPPLLVKSFVEKIALLSTIQLQVGMLRMWKKSIASKHVCKALCKGFSLLGVGEIKF